MELSVEKELTKKYERYYADSSLTEWRRLGAVDKCGNIAKLCANFPHDGILEIGCGEGALLERLAHLHFGLRLTGLEISPSGVQRVEEKHIPCCTAQLFDGYQIPFPSEHFDLAILSHVLEHVEYPRRLIQEAARVAKTVFVEVPLEDNWRLSPDFEPDHVGHINFYNPKTIRRLVQSCGMTVIEGQTSHSSVETYVFRKGELSGTATFWLKQAMLRLSATFATNAMTYHYSLTYARASRTNLKSQAS
jgi:ubiquinone/menaquinone biosynthesis C-methylase UbiE